MEHKSNFRKISSRQYYITWHGHEVHYLEDVCTQLRSKNKRLIWLAGDSSLDNKYWFESWRSPVNGYESILTNQMKADVCYWINKEITDLAQQGTRSSRVDPQQYACINTAVEATTLGQRENGWFSSHDNLTPQDKFLRSNIGSDDILVCSVGGNDIALAPATKTVLSALWLTSVSKESNVKSGSAWGYGHFADLFGARTESYLKRLVAETKPKMIVICIIYFLDENPESASWAGPALKLLKYNSKPDLLQAAILHIYETGTKSIQVDGVDVIPCPLFKVLDGKDSADYVARVEPSAQGGEKMAKFILDKIMNGAKNNKL